MKARTSSEVLIAALFALLSDVRTGAREWGDPR
jgi:hypothetical protein